MNLRLAAAALCMGAILASNGASTANAFGFGLFGGCGGCGASCCDIEPSCGCEPSCCVAEPTCGCEPSCCDPCAAPRRCCLFGGLKGLFKRHHHGCCEPTCGCEPTCCAPEPTCCAPEPSCCVEEPSCGCEPECCDPCAAPRRCGLFGGLKGLFKRHRGCCEPSCCVEEPSCGCEPSCAVAPSCGC